MKTFLTLLVGLVVLLTSAVPTVAQEDPCVRETVIRSFARAVSEDGVEAWQQGYATSDCPSQIKVGARMLLAAYMTMDVDIIPFEVPAGSGQLNPALGWQPGGSKDNRYALLVEPGALAMISGWGNGQWDADDTAPLVTYALSGDFEAQIRVDVSETEGNHLAALGVRAMDDPLTWVRIARRNDTSPPQIAVETNSQKQSISITTAPFADKVVYFKIIRRGAAFSLFFSTEGINWQTLKEDFAFPMPDATELFFTYYLTPPPPVGDLRALFSDFSVIVR